MKGFLLLSLFTFYSCTSSPGRAPSSIELIGPGEFSLTNSQIRLISTKKINEEYAHFFYFEAMDENYRLLDINPREMTFRLGDRKLDIDYFSDSLGKYYYRLFFKNIPKLNGPIKVYFNQDYFAEVDLKQKDKLLATDISQSKMRIVEFRDHTYRFELDLINSEGRVINSTQKPEIYTEGASAIVKTYSIGPGRWGGEVRITDTNAIIYLSLRLKSSRLPRLLRIQHIEK